MPCSLPVPRCLSHALCQVLQLRKPGLTTPIAGLQGRLTSAGCCPESGRFASPAQYARHHSANSRLNLFNYSKTCNKMCRFFFFFMIFVYQLHNTAPKKLQNTRNRKQDIQWTFLNSQQLWHFIYIVPRIKRFFFFFLASVQKTEKPGQGFTSHSYSTSHMSHSQPMCLSDNKIAIIFVPRKEQIKANSLVARHFSPLNFYFGNEFFVQNIKKFEIKQPYQLSECLPHCPVQNNRQQVATERAQHCITISCLFLQYLHSKQ